MNQAVQTPPDQYHRGELEWREVPRGLPRSLERQTWKNREFILVDNGSTDGSAEYIRDWGSRVPDTQRFSVQEHRLLRGQQPRVCQGAGRMDRFA